MGYIYYMSMALGHSASQTLTINPSDAAISITADEPSVAEITLDGLEMNVKGINQGSTCVTVTACKDGYESVEKSFWIMVGDLP
jgi:hypothetical protein